MADIKGNFRLVFPEQIAAFRLRLRRLIPTARWDDFLREAHDSGFMVAGAVKAELLADLASAVDRAIAEGTGWQAFQKDFRAIVEKNGWHGWTGEETAKGRAWRMKVIYKTNMRTSYAAGRWAQIKSDGFPLIVYRHGGSLEPRLQHLEWDGLILPADHPFWVTHAPPNGWGCSCFVVGARTERGAVRVGGRPSLKLPATWNTRDPRTGAPPGIDRGWDYAPGASVSPIIQAMAQKSGGLQYHLAKAFMQDVPEATRDLLADAYRSLPSTADSTRRYVERVIGVRNGAPIPGPVNVEEMRTLGLLTRNHADLVSRLVGRDVSGFDFTLDPSGITHAFNKHGDAAREAKRGQTAVSPEIFGDLPVLLRNADEFTLEGVAQTGGQVIRITKQVGKLKVIALFEVRPGRKRLTLVSLWINGVVGKSSP